MNKLWKLYGMTSLIIVLLIFSGCEVKSISDYFNEEKNIDLESIESGKYQQEVFCDDGTAWLNMCDFLKRYGPAAMGLSFLTGLLTYFLFRFEKTIQQFALFGMMIGFPVTVFIVIYAVCYLYGILY